MDQAVVGKVRRISQCTISPKHVSDESRCMHYLTPWELSMLSKDYAQVAVVFTKPQTPTNILIDHLKDSLSQTLSHFPTLTGRLVTKKGVNPPSYTVYLDCTYPRGAEFVHAVADFTISDIFSPNKDILGFFQSFYAFEGAVNHDGHTKPLLAVQVTELVDGILMASNLNHCVADGTSVTHFTRTWAEISKGNTQGILLPSLTKYWFNDKIINLPYSHHDEFIKRKKTPLLRMRMFHFSRQSIARIRIKATAEAHTRKISPFQALTAFVWRSMTRARNLAFDQKTSCTMVTNDRLRIHVHPPLPVNYFTTLVGSVDVLATTGELLGNDLGWSASLLHVAVTNHTDEKIRTWVDCWVKNPQILRLEEICQVPTVRMMNSPRFDVYGTDFGWGKPLVVRGGLGKILDGIVVCYAAREEEGGVDLEINLSPESMSSLLSDDDFMSAVSPQFLFGKSNI